MPIHDENGRRSFLKKTALATLMLTTSDLVGADRPIPSDKDQQMDVPWYRQITRWGQVNITEKDPAQYDISWWRKFWKRTDTKGVIINAGGIVSYYPTK